MLRDALVESFEAGGQQSEPLLVGELLHDVLCQLPALRRQRDHTLVGNAVVHRIQGSRDDVHAQHHACTTAVGLVVDLGSTKRRAVAVRKEPQIELGPEDGCDRTLLRQPGEGMRNQSEDIELHGRASQVS